MIIWESLEHLQQLVVGDFRQTGKENLPKPHPIASSLARQLSRRQMPRPLWRDFSAPLSLSLLHWIRPLEQSMSALFLGGWVSPVSWWMEDQPTATQSDKSDLPVLAF